MARPRSTNYIGKICSIEGCCRKFKAGRFCNVHYCRWMEHGDPLICKKRANGAGAIDKLTGRMNFNGTPRATIVMEKIIGRKLRKGELVHHKDRNPSNDSPENLQLCKNQSEHMKIHGFFRNKNFPRCKYSLNIPTLRRKFYVRMAHIVRNILNRNLKTMKSY